MRRHYLRRRAAATATSWMAATLSQPAMLTRTAKACTYRSARSGPVAGRVRATGRITGLAGIYGWESYPTGESRSGVWRADRHRIEGAHRPHPEFRAPERGGR
jgi:hypothetical protein